VKMSAWLAGTGSINPATNASRQDRIELLGSDSFMFASLLAERTGTAVLVLQASFFAL
jgi:hypothetical protein